MDTYPVDSDEKEPENRIFSGKRVHVKSHESEMNEQESRFLRASKRALLVPWFGRWLQLRMLAIKLTTGMLNSVSVFAFLSSRLEGLY